MTFNIRYDNPRDSANAWNNRSELVSEFIQREEPDVIGLQEVLWHQYEFLDSALAGYSSVSVGRSDGVKAGEANPVFFRKDRLDMVRTITFWLSENPDSAGSKSWGSSLPRIVTWMELVEKETHEHFFVFNTHFAHDSDSARTESARLLLSKAVEISAGFPFIITGDFNMYPDSRGYSILTGPAESVPIIQDSFVISDEKPFGPMFTFNGFSDKPGTGRIDYIFVRSGMPVTDHRTIIRKDGKVFISDHWPVIATVELKGI
jgi:endonuclease/exonuclease/phosphatase family metal-dependent hydrolase